MPSAAQAQHQRGKKACQQEFAPALEAEIARLVAPGAVDQLDFEAVETGVRRRALQLAARAGARRLNADRSDGQAHTQPCSCGRAALGMAGTSLSPAVTRMTGSAAAVASFATASDLLDKLAAVRVNAKRVERVAEALGREVAAAERAAVFAPEAPAAPTMYLGVDGTGVPMRPPQVAGRPGKHSDGSASTREAKLVVIWTAEQCDQHGLPDCDEGSVTYSAAIDSAAARDTDATPASPCACDARPSGAASRMRRARSSSATARNGFLIPYYMHPLRAAAGWNRRLLARGH
ncbi:MAG: hypothetical protein OXC19_24700 [Bryobacterales bacterium]|nr:hypothetical protein [Bryobacterales bacterium]